MLVFLYTPEGFFANSEGLGRQSLVETPHGDHNWTNHSLIVFIFA